LHSASAILREPAYALTVQVGVVTDITARKSTAEAMHLCDKALAATSEATLITDGNHADNPIIYCNSGFTKLLGARNQCSAVLQLNPLGMCRTAHVHHVRAAVVLCPSLIPLGCAK
jgi:PAS domain-containing protein